MAWVVPKTDWNGYSDADGVYHGDRFNAADFNRIKNNLSYIRELAIKMYDEFEIESMGNDRTASDYFYADEINQMEENLNTINANTLQRDYGEAPLYFDNGNTMDYKELNRLEGAILDLYGQLTNQADGRRQFEWNFGMSGGEL